MKDIKKIIKFIIFILFIIFLVIFIVQNLSIAKFNFFTFSIDLPVVSIILISGLIFYILGILSSFYIFKFSTKKNSSIVPEKLEKNKKR